MPIALLAPSCEYMSRFALRLGFLLVVDWIDKDWSAVLVHTSARPCKPGRHVWLRPMVGRAGIDDVAGLSFKQPGQGGCKRL